MPILKICQRYKMTFLYIVSNAKKNYFLIEFINKADVHHSQILDKLSFKFPLC